MTLGSLFDGSGTCPLAAAMCGITPVWASEIEPYFIRVTKKNFSKMLHLGDITQINGAEIEPVDIVTFGSPCQDLSEAGAQKGLVEGKRSVLFFDAIRIIKEMREATHGKYPRYAIWENVPGAFSSNQGRDFLAVLRAFAEAAGGDGADVPEPASKGGKLKWANAGSIVGEGFSIAWRVLDAKYWGVPQRRKRIYLVADFGGQRAGEILFKREGLRGDSTQSRAARKETAADAVGSTGGSCGTVYALQGNGIDRADTAGCNGRGWREDACYTLNTIDRPAICFKAGQGGKARSLGESETVAPTLGSEAGGNSVPSVCYPQIARSLTAEADASPCIDRGQNVVCIQNTGYGWWNQGDIAETLRTPTGGDGTKANLVVELYDARGNGDGTHCPTLTGDHENRVTDYTAVCCEEVFPQVTGCLCANTHPGGVTGQDAFSDMLPVTPGKPPRKYLVRRLTPLECYRLQGFPDWWEAGAEGSDSARYKMWGNGMALPCVLYVMEGIANEM